MCGVLYAVDSVVERLTKIRLALDLYRNTLLEDVNLAFTNPFKRTTTVGYNHKTKVSSIKLFNPETIIYNVYNVRRAFIRIDIAKGAKK